MWEVSASKLDASSVGLRSYEIDSVSLVLASSGSLSELFQQRFPSQIRAYGPSGLSTPSFRGVGASHTAVLWHGISLQSPLTGQLDISQIPVGEDLELTIQMGGASSLYGSGAIGGTIQIRDRPAFGRGQYGRIGLAIGSFGRRQASFALGSSNGGYSIVVQGTGFEVKNDYPYTSPYLKPQKEETRQHSAFGRQGIRASLDLLPSPQHLLGIKIWLQESRYEVPNSILSIQNAEAVQWDRPLRALLQWDWDMSRMGLAFKQAYIRQRTQFVDPKANIDAVNTSESWVSRAEVDWSLHHGFAFVGGGNFQCDRAIEGSFSPSSPTRISIAAFASLRWKSATERTHAALTIRQEMMDAKRMPVAPSLGLEHLIAKRVKLYGSISASYRIPTFNDLYWSGVGSTGTPDLKAERAKGGEMGLAWAIASKPSRQVDLSGTLYSQTVDHWVQWLPDQQGIWSPTNLKKVWARGGEAKLDAQWTHTKMTFKSWVAIRWTQTTNQALGSSTNSLELGKQLPYSPLMDGTVHVQAKYVDMTWTTTLAHVSKQFTESENKDVFALPSYQTLSCSVLLEFDHKTLSGTCSLQLNNLLDAQFENRRGYPIYGRNYRIGLNFHIHKKRT